MTTRLSAVDLAIGYDNRWPAATGITFAVSSGESVSIQGRSGSGKTSLLLSLNGLLRPIDGQVQLDDRDLWSLTDRRRSRLRLYSFGFVFQFGEMLTELSVVENVALPLLLQGNPEGEARKKAQEILARLGVDHLAQEDIRGISGGELQRVAVGRALVHNPAVVLADEPTGALDVTNAEMVMGLLIEMCEGNGTILVVVTHDERIAEMTQRRLDLSEISVTGPIPPERQAAAVRT